MRPALCIALLTVSFVAAPAQSFFAVDITTSELVIVDVATGAVAVRGPLGVMLTGNVHLEWHGGQLYLLARTTSFWFSELLRLDPDTGAVISQVPTTLNGTVTAGETLFSTGDKLYMSADPGADTTSELIVELDPATGVMTTVADFTGALDDDMDGVAFDAAAGLLWNLDSDGAPGAHTNLYLVDLANATQTLVTAYGGSLLGACDPFISGTTLFASGHTPSRVESITLPGGSLTSTTTLATANDVGGIAPTLQYAGTLEDVLLATAVNAGAFSNSAGSVVRTVIVGDLVSVRISTPNGAFLGAPIVLAAQINSMNTLLTTLLGPPFQHVWVFPYIELVNGLSASSPLGSLHVLAPAGLTYGFQVPAGMAGMQVALQAAAVAPNAANGLVAVTSVHLVQIP